MNIQLGNPPRIIIFSDIHFHEYKPFSIPTEHGIGSRFHWLLTAFQTIIEYAHKENIEHIFFLGDLFHQRTLLYSIVFDKVSDVINDAVKSGIKFHFILGNHDYIYNNDTSPSIVKRFSGVDIIDNAKIYNIKDYNISIACIPFRFDIENLKRDLSYVESKTKPGDLLFGHFELSGAKVVDEYVLKDSVDPKLFSDLHFNTIFSGHIHTSQTIQLGKSKIEFVGHTLHNTFNDGNTKYGFYVYDFKHKKYKFIPLKSLKEFPEFKTVDLHTEEDIKNFVKTESSRFNLDYYRIRAYSEELNIDKILQKLTFYTSEYIGPMIQQSNDNDDTTVQFNLDLKYYLKFFLEQESNISDLSWLDSRKLSEHLDNLFTKGRIKLD